MRSRIPIANIYYLLLYAWDHFPEGGKTEVGKESSPDLPNLLAKVLLSGTRRLLRRGVDRGYAVWEEETSSPRGRLLLGPSMQRGILPLNRVVCEYDELTADVPHNRVLKAALADLARSPQVDATLVTELNLLRAQFAGVLELKLSNDLFKSLQLSRNTGHYGILMNVCRMVLETLQPVENATGSKFAAIAENEVSLSTIFEAFALNFYKHEQSEFKVDRENIRWDVTCADTAHLVFLPSMRTDVTLRSATRTLVIDAKFYRETLVSFRNGRPKIRSTHLYQVFTYLRNLDASPEQQSRPEGILLYPSVDGRELALKYEIGHHRLGVWSVNLLRPWREIHDRMMQVLANGNAESTPVQDTVESDLTARPEISLSLRNH